LALPFPGQEEKVVPDARLFCKMRIRICWETAEALENELAHMHKV
jgi:hypothetical protein